VDFAAEVALYPLKTSNAGLVIDESIKSLEKLNLKYSVGPMSTQIYGTSEEVWSSLRSLFEKAQANGEVSMVVTLTNASHATH
jgi:uncharacterized protein YqgV (UPF0045/DUF77 family)